MRIQGMQNFPDRYRHRQQNPQESGDDSVAGEEVISVDCCFEQFKSTLLQLTHGCDTAAAVEMICDKLQEAANFGGLDLEPLFRQVRQCSEKHDALELLRDHSKGFLFDRELCDHHPDINDWKKASVEQKRLHSA